MRPAPQWLNLRSLTAASLHLQLPRMGTARRQWLPNTPQATRPQMANDSTYTRRTATTIATSAAGAAAAGEAAEVEAEEVAAVVGAAAVTSGMSRLSLLFRLCPVCFLILRHEVPAESSSSSD